MINRASSHVSTTPDLLKVMYETPVNTLATEKGDCFIDQNIIESQKNDFTCYYCGQTRSSRAGRINHEKKHRKAITKEKRKRSAERTRNEYNIFTCDECGLEFSRKAVLTKHLKTHVQEIECDACHAKFKDPMDFEWHDAINDGKIFGRDDNEKMFHRTRSQSRLSCHSVIQQNSRPQSCGPILTSTTPINGFPDKTKRKRSPSSLSARSTPYKKIRNAPNDFLSDSSEEEVIQNDTSDNSINDINDIPIASCPEFQYKGEATVELYKVFQCSDYHCSKYFFTVDLLTLHEISMHNKLALFRCRECRKRYTSRLGLKEHQNDSHPFQILCVLCDGLTHSLDIETHVRLHQETSIICEQCGKQFLDKAALEEHLVNPNAHRLHYPRRINLLVRLNTGEPYKTLQYRFEQCESDTNFGAFYMDYVDTNVHFNELQVHMPWRT